MRTLIPENVVRDKKTRKVSIDNGFLENEINGSKSFSHDYSDEADNEIEDMIRVKEI